MKQHTKKFLIVLASVALMMASVLMPSVTFAQSFYPDNQGANRQAIDQTYTGSISPDAGQYNQNIINQPNPEDIKKKKEQIASHQIIMARAGVSSGVIDGAVGSNYKNAISAFEKMTGRNIDVKNDKALLVNLNASGGPAFTDYVIKQDDISQFYVAEIPTDYAKKAALPSLAFTSTREMLAERFHIDEKYLQEINPNVDFNRHGVTIKVPNLQLPKRKKVFYVIADKKLKQVFGYGEDGSLVVAYPSTIGSSDNPSPSGTLEVKRIAINPNYTYNPKINFKQGTNDSVLTLPPGPNGPVGTVWIALSKPTYGIHGTPDPSKIGKTSSHGCVRLTNWDATELAHLVSAGVIVHFQ